MQKLATPTNARDSERPNVCFLIVWLTTAQLWCEVSRRANKRRGQIRGAREGPRHPKVTNFNGVIGTEENIVRLQVTVHHTLRVDAMQAE